MLYVLVPIDAKFSRRLLDKLVRDLDTLDNRGVRFCFAIYSENTVQKKILTEKIHGHLYYGISSPVNRWEQILGLRTSFYLTKDDYVTFMDADDFISAYGVRYQELLKGKERPEFVICNCKRSNPELTKFQDRPYMQYMNFSYETYMENKIAHTPWGIWVRGDIIENMPSPFPFLKGDDTEYEYGYEFYVLHYIQYHAAISDSVIKDKVAEYYWIEYPASQTLSSNLSEKMILNAIKQMDRVDFNREDERDRVKKNILTSYSGLILKQETEIEHARLRIEYLIDKSGLDISLGDVLDGCTVNSGNSKD